MTTELREALNSAFEESEKPDAQETTTAVEPVEGAADAEVSGGQDSQDAAETTPVEAKQDKPVDKAESKAAHQESKPDVPAGVHRVDRAPASWKKEAKGEWASVPLHIRQEVHRREMEINRALNDATQRGQVAQQFEQIAQPYMARMQSFGVTPQQAFQQLLGADYQLATGTPQQKAQLIDKMLQDYGVDIATLDNVIATRLNGGQQPQQQQQPDIQALVQQQLQQALAPLYQQQQQAYQAQQAQINQTVEQMSLDPRYPYFEEVRQEMADLVEVAARRGVALSLEDAYSKAILMNPHTQQSMQQQTAMQQANQQNLQAQRAKAASSSVTGAPASGGTGQFSGDGSVRGALEAAFANVRI